LGGSVAFFPLVGALLGVLLASADTLTAFILPPTPRDAILLALWVLLTGSLHLDGFLDTCDGLLGGRTPEERLHIMRDERVGAYAFAGGALLLILKFSALLSLPLHWEAVVMAATLGRWGMSLAIVAFPYARAEGLGRSIKDHAGWLHAGIATLITLAVVWLTAELAGLVMLVLAAVVLWLGARFTLRLIPGLTGDVYGALNETIELMVLLAMVARPYIFG
jgi:adenosylcobinamide-GDP ribazoletransferase